MTATDANPRTPAPAPAPAKGILDNPHDTLPPRRTSSASESGFKAALKATFLPAPTPGRLAKHKGQPLGKTFRRTQPLPSDFEGAQVLPFDPRGEHASVGDGILELPRRGSDSTTDTESSLFDDQDQDRDQEPERGRGRSMCPGMGRRESSVASTSTTSTTSSCAIRFAPLPVSGRLKRANSITIGVAARSHLLQSQGSAAPPRQEQIPQHVHASQQQWYVTGTKPDDVIDVGEEIRKGAVKAWNRIRGTSTSTRSGSSSGSGSGANVHAKEGAPVADPRTGEIKVLGGPGVDKPDLALGDDTPVRVSSPVPTDELRHLAIAEAPDEDELPEGPQHETYHLGEGHDDDGMQTPRSLQRRLSTGTFLRGLSLREIQETRRRDLLGTRDGDGDGEAQLEPELDHPPAEPGRVGAV